MQKEIFKRYDFLNLYDFKEAIYNQSFCLSYGSLLKAFEVENAWWDHGKIFTLQPQEVV